MAGAYIAISLSESDINIVNNTSVVTANVYYYGNGVSWSNNQHSGGITIDGTSYSFTNTFTKSTGAQWLGSASKTIAHNSDGSRSVSVSSWFATGVSIGTLSTSNSIVLTTIPRASSISIASGIVGGTSDYTISSYVGSFTHNVYYTLGGVKYYICTSTAGGTYTYTIPSTEEFLTAITSSTGVIVTVYCETYSGNTKIGSTTSNTMTIGLRSTDYPSIPTITLTKSGNTSVGEYLKKLSTVTINSSATASIGTTISSYTYEVTGNSPATGKGTSYVSNLPTAGTVTIKVTVYDKRGRSKSNTQTITVYEYTAPKIDTFLVHRSKVDGSESPDGTYVNIYCSFSICSVGTNVSDIKLYYKPYSSYDYILLPTTITNGVWSNLIIIDGGFLVSQSYNFKIVLTDTVGNTDTFIGSIFTAERVMSFKDDGSGLTIGAYAEKGGFNVEWDASFNKSLSVGDIDYTVTDEEYDAMSTMLGGTVTDEQIQDFINGSVGSDYIIDAGIDGDWVYRKWNSGVAECWKKIDAVGGTGAAEGASYWKAVNIDFPPSLFNSPPVVTPTAVGNWVGGAQVYSTSKLACRCILWAFTNNVGLLGMNVRVIGIWKEL